MIIWMIVWKVINKDMCLSKLPCIVWNFDLLWGNFEISHGLWPQKKLNRLILVKILIKLSCFFFIVVIEQNIAVPLYLYPISMIKVSGDFKVASEVSKFPTMRGNFERHIFYWLIFIWSHYWRKKSIQLGELTNTYVKMYQVITSLQVSTVIFTLKVENTTKLPRFTVFIIQFNEFIR